MATLSLPMPARSDSRRGWGLLEQDMGTRPEGPSGAALVSKLEAVWRHFTQSAEVQSALADVDEEIEYRPMPPKRSFEMVVYLDMQGRGTPMPYPMDDDILE